MLLYANLVEFCVQYASRDQNCDSMTINDKNQLLLIGQSKDIGRCKSQKKNGGMCQNIVNRCVLTWRHVSQHRQQVRADVQGECVTVLLFRVIVITVVI